MKRIYLAVLLLLSLSAHSQVLLTESFEGTAFPPAGWGLHNSGTSPNNWDQFNNSVLIPNIGFGAQDGANIAGLLYDPTNAANGWLTTPPKMLTAGTAYTLSFYYAVADPTYPEKMKVTVGSDTFVSMQTTVLWNNNGADSLVNNTWAQALVQFTPTTTGNYSFGFNCYSDPDEFLMMLDNIRLEVTPGSAPNCAMLMSPANNTTNVSIDSVTLTWNSVPGATSYDVYIEDVNPPTFLVTTITDTTITLFGGAYGATYYWYVVPRNAAGPATGCAGSAFHFTIEAAPTPPTCATLITPANAATNVTAPTAPFVWSSTANTIQYAFYFGTTNPPDSLGVIPDTTVTLSPLAYNTTYYWSAVPENAGGSATGCAVYSFTTMAAPAVPTNDSVCNAINLTLNGPAHCGSTGSATSYSDPALTCSTPNNTVWYTYTPAASGDVTVKMKRPASANQYTALNGWVAFFTAAGTCPSFTLTQVGNCMQTNLAADDSVYVTFTGLTGGTQYYIVVDGYAGAYGDYCIGITGPSAPPANDSCGAAVSLAVNVPASGTTLGATQSMMPELCNGFTGFSDDDVWYSFTPATSGNYKLTLTASGGFDGVIIGYTGTCGALTSIGCADSTLGGGIENFQLPGLVAGTTYYFRVYSWNNGATGGFSLVVSNNAMPVTLTSFKGVKDGAVNRLTWTTASEENSRGFELQLSVDGKNFNALSFIESKGMNGSSSATLNYAYTDTKPFAGSTYYRLRQIDNDGRFRLSDVVVIKGDKVNSIVLNTLYPNPATSKVNVVLSAPASAEVSLIITDLAGKVVLKQAAQVVAGDNNFALPVSSLPSGSYLVKVVCSNGCETAVSKLFKQ